MRSNKQSICLSLCVVMIVAAAMGNTAEARQSAAPAMSQGDLNDIEGINGKVNVVPNIGLHQVVVEFISSTPRNAASSQIVFVLQGNFSEVSRGWSGDGRVLFGKGVVAVLPSEEGSSIPIQVYKFASRELPQSMNDWKASAYEIYGIARYGEQTPLTPQQLTSLETTGRVPPDRPLVDDVLSTRLDKISVDGVTPDNAKPGGSCPAGGPGSSQCSNGCSVTCNSGFYSCCSPGSCVCVQIP